MLFLFSTLKHQMFCYLSQCRVHDQYHYMVEKKNIFFTTFGLYMRLKCGVKGKLRSLIYGIVDTFIRASV